MSNNKKDPETQKIIVKEKTKEVGSDEYAISPFGTLYKTYKRTSIQKPANRQTKDKKREAKTITERLNSFDEEVDTFFKGNCEIQPKDRIVYLRDKAKNLGLNLRDSEIRAKIWEGRKRSKGLVTMLAPDMEINAPQEVWLVEDLIMKSDTNLLIASPKVGKTTLVVDLIGKWSRGVEDSYLGKKFIGKCPPAVSYTHLRAHET